MYYLYLVIRDFFANKHSKFKYSLLISIKAIKDYYIYWQNWLVFISKKLLYTNIIYYYILIITSLFKEDVFLECFFLFLCFCVKLENWISFSFNNVFVHVFTTKKNCIFFNENFKNTAFKNTLITDTFNAHKADKRL